MSTFVQSVSSEDLCIRIRPAQHAGAMRIWLAQDERIDHFAWLNCNGCAQAIWLIIINDILEATLDPQLCTQLQSVQRLNYNLVGGTSGHLGAVAYLEKYPFFTEQASMGATVRTENQQESGTG